MRVDRLELQIESVRLDTRRALQSLLVYLKFVVSPLQLVALTDLFEVSIRTFTSSIRSAVDPTNKKTDATTLSVRNMIFTRDRKYFRFQFLALPLLLLISTTQAVSVPKGCAEVASTWMKNMELASIVQDTDSLNNLVDCFQGMYKLIEGADWKTVQDNIPKGVKDLVQKIPNLMDKAKSFASKGELVVWSVYLGYKSIELYDRATQLKITVKKHRQEFDLLKVKLKPI